MCDRAADRALVPRHDMADVGKRRVDERMGLLLASERGLRHRRADPEHAVRGDAVEAGPVRGRRGASAGRDAC